MCHALEEGPVCHAIEEGPVCHAREEGPLGCAPEEDSVLIIPSQVRHDGAGVGDGSDGRRRDRLAPSAQAWSSRGSLARHRAAVRTRNRSIGDRALTGRSPNCASLPAGKRASSEERIRVVRRPRSVLPDQDSVVGVRQQACEAAGVCSSTENDVGGRRLALQVSGAEEEKKTVVPGGMGSIMIHETHTHEYHSESAVVSSLLFGSAPGHKIPGETMPNAGSTVKKRRLVPFD